MPFDVPDPRFVGSFENQRYMGYRRLPGQAYMRGDDIESIAHALARLHAFPVDTAAQLLGVPATMEGWVQSYLDLRSAADKEAIPLLPAEAADALNRAFDTFLTTDWGAVPPTFVHCDLGAEHILMDRDSQQLSGMIDFGDMTVGDATIDFVGLRISAGARLVDKAIRAYGGVVDKDRMRFYVQVGALYAILYGQLIGDEELVVDAVRSLERRLLGHDLGRD
jgi:aminoglycoside 2''-phosphotransferase